MKTKPIACFRLRLPGGQFLAALVVAALISPAIAAAPAQQAYLKASNTDAGNSFGRALAASGNTLVIGAFKESSAATGVNGNQNDNSAADSGAACVFTGLGIGPSLALLPDSSGGSFIRCAAHAGLSYQLLRAADLSSPWPSIATNTAPPSGLLEFHDTTPLSGQAFYRVGVP